MWIALAVVAFLAGQLYLLRCLRKVDRFLQQSPEKEPQKQVLSIALADPAMTEGIAQLLEGFSGRYPDMEIVLHAGQDPAEAVAEGSAEVGFLPAGEILPQGLSRTAFREGNEEIVWKRVAPASPGDCFVGYLWEQGMIGGGKSGQDVV